MIKQIIKWLVFELVYPTYYHLCSIKKINEKKIIFVENHMDSLSDNFLLIKDVLESSGYIINIHYLMVAQSAWKDIISRTLRLIKDIATAKCVFISESNSVFGSFKIRSETKLVQLWHACGAFKKWGFSVADLSFGDSTKDLRRYSGHGNYALVPVSGSEVCEKYVEAFGLQGKCEVVKPIGVSRTDVYFDEEYRKQAVMQLKNSNLPVNGRRIILYAPTFRGDIKEAHTPDEFDYNEFYQRFHNEYLLLVKQHPFVKNPVKIEDELKDSIIEIRDELTINELLMVSDICITDYSSVIFEYSLLEKPMIFYAYDLSEYYDERGFYYPYDEFVPGEIVKNMGELIDAVEDIDGFDKNRILQFRNLYMDGCDGHATERILKEIFGDNLGGSYGK